MKKKLFRWVAMALVGMLPICSLQAGQGADLAASPTTWGRFRRWAGSPQARDAALVTGAIVGGALLVAFAAPAAPVGGAAVFVAKAALGSALGAAVFTKVRAAIAGSQDRARSNLPRDAAMVIGTGVGAFAAVPLLPSVGLLAGWGVLLKLVAGGVVGGGLVKGASALLGRSSASASASALDQAPTPAATPTATTGESGSDRSPMTSSAAGWDGPLPGGNTPLFVAPTSAQPREVTPPSVGPVPSWTEPPLAAPPPATTSGGSEVPGWDDLNGLR